MPGNVATIVNRAEKKQQLALCSLLLPLTHSALLQKGCNLE